MRLLVSMFVCLFIFIFLKEVSYQDCIYLIKIILKYIFYLNILSNVMYFCDANLNFWEPLLQCHMILQKSVDSSILICFSINIYYYYQCWKQKWRFKILWKTWDIFTFFYVENSLINRKFKISFEWTKRFFLLSSFFHYHILTFQCILAE